MTQTTSRDQLMHDGFCVFENALSHQMLQTLRDVTSRLIDAQSDEHRERFRSQGSMIRIIEDPLFANLIAWPAALAALHTLGFAHPSFSDGYIISKPPHSPRLFWHYDWFAWEDPRSYELSPPQVFLMYYLTDTRRENGCLRVIPGSHVAHNPLHDVLAAPHSEAISKADAQRVEFDNRPDEVDVPVRAGDLLIGDARLLHATHANEIDERRTLLTLWYQPDLRSLPERMQAQMAKKAQRIDHWRADARAKVQSLWASYSGDAAPYERSLYRRRVIA